MTHALSLGGPSERRIVPALRRSLHTLQGSAGLLGLVFTLWRSSFHAGGVAALAKAAIWTLVWPLWLLYLVAVVGVSL